MRRYQYLVKIEDSRLTEFKDWCKATGVKTSVDHVARNSHTGEIKHAVFRVRCPTVSLQAMFKLTWVGM